MDPLSITASVLTIVGTAEAIRGGIQNLRRLQQAPEHLDSLNNEITELELLLTIIRPAIGRLRGDDAADAIRLASPTVLETERVLHELIKLVNNNLTKEGNANTNSSHVANSQVLIRRRGFLKTQRFQESCIKLRDMRMRLSTVLNVLTHLEVRTGLPQLTLEIQNISLMDASGQTESSTTISATDGPSLKHLLHNAMAENELNSAGQRSSIVLTTASISRKCPPFCSCQCHIRGAWNSSHWCQRFFGLLLFQYSGTPYLNRRPCNFSQCKPNGGSVRFVYRFPTSLLPWIVSINANWDCYGTLQGGWSLQPLQYVPETMTWNIRRIIRHSGNAQELEKYMELHRISPRAVFSTGRQLSLLDEAVSVSAFNMSEFLLHKGADWHYRALDNRYTASVAWSTVLQYPKLVPASFKSYLEESDTLEPLKLNVAHRIAVGQLNARLEDQLDLHPNLVHEKDSFGEIPFSWAVRTDNFEVASILLQRGSNVNNVNSSGETALHHAVTSPDLRLLELLVSSEHTDINFADSYGVTPLMLAARLGRTEHLRRLLELGADPNINPSDKYCIPALFWAIEADEICSLEVLCQYGADIHIRRTFDGSSAAMYAASCNSVDSLQFLIEEGVCLDSMDDDGCSILNYAAVHGDIGIMRTLTKAHIRGLPMDCANIKEYWRMFDARNEWMAGPRAPVEEERAAFQALLNSIQPGCDSDDESEDDYGSEDDDDEQFVDAHEDFSSLQGE